MKLLFFYGRKMLSLPISLIGKSQEKRIPLLFSFLLLLVTSLFIQMLWSQHEWLNKLQNYNQEKISAALLKHWQPIADHFYEHHSQLKTHQFQMELGSLLKPELHEIMSKQYDIPHGLYNGKPYKKILYWNNAGTFPVTRENSNFGLGVGRDRYEKAGCPVWQCETSEDRTDLLQYDVIIFNQHRWNWSDLPEKRSPHQLYIFFSYEPPTLFRLIGNWDQIWNSMKGPFFNWTMTYRWDSDIVNPYGWIEPINPTVVPIHPDAALYSQLIEESHKDEVNYAAGKTKMAVFFQTSCHDRFSNRNELINKLKESGVEIDLYGACHELQCAFNKFSLYREEEEHERCMEMAAKKYKFYIAFHNSLCLDYTPERFMHSMLHSMIPIVMDLHGNHAKLAPPHSFINALDFPSPRHLANYLIKLDQNDTLYNEYFWWKKHYRIRNGLFFDGMHYKNYCSLCAALHDPSRNLNWKSYSDIKSWWNDTAECQTVKFDGMYGINYFVSNSSYSLLGNSSGVSSGLGNLSTSTNVTKL